MFLLRPLNSEAPKKKKKKKKKNGERGDDERWRRGDEVPVDAVDVAIREQRTLVMHNLEVYWPPVGELVRQVVRYFHAYSQVNVYMSPAELSVATTAHCMHLACGRACALASCPNPFAVRPSMHRARAVREQGRPEPGLIVMLIISELNGARGGRAGR